MFTGLVEACVPVLATESLGAAGMRLALSSPGWDVSLGESVSVSGCCLTLAARSAGPGGEALVFELSAETLSRTWLGGATPGRRVNLERALQLGDRLGGHLVLGHVDALGTLEALRDTRDGGRLFTFGVPAGFERYLLDKGSVTVDGISLTVVAPRGRSFDVAVIPTTLAVTSLGSARPGERVNLEADLIGKWVERLLQGSR
jgi:riboflavin synthase